MSAAAEDNAVCSYHINVPEEAIVDSVDALRRRGGPPGDQLAKIQELVRYWATEYDWRKAEAKLNALPQFVTTIDGLDIQFVHVRSRHAKALPLIITHGWPGSILELVKVIGPLTDPTAFGGRAEDAFDLVLLGARLWLLGSAEGHWLGSRPHRARLGRADGASGIQTLCASRRRLGLCHLGRDGEPGTRGTAWHSRQYARDRATGNRQGSQLWRARPGKAVPRGKGCVRTNGCLATPS
jgi:hypothetical protein